ncbi:DUF433 domain-containing protein [Natronorarus salvus]|uniref:DUF433 domain-containing protein n=1 Tax=Natronorarus salvus TaxID=3117733 RepID=UPI002F26D3B2
MKAVVTGEGVLGGDPRLDGTRIGVIHVDRRYEGGETPGAIAASFDGLSVADVHSALAFAFVDPQTLRSTVSRSRSSIERIREDRPVDPKESPTHT